MSTRASTVDEDSAVFLVLSSLFDPAEMFHAEAKWHFFSSTYPYALVPVLALAAYFAYYLRKVVHKPAVYGDQNGLAAYLLSKCPILSQYYWPTFWCWSFHCATIVRSVFQNCPSLSVKRQVLQLSDGGVLGLDWIEGHERLLEFEDETPIVIILPGMSGSSDENYVRHFAVDVLSQGCRPVVYIARGIGGLTLTTARMFALNNTEDLRSALASIRSQYPKAPIIGFGVCYGGALLTWYLIESGSKSLLSAAAVFSSIWTPAESVAPLESSFIDRSIYVYSIASALRVVVNRNAHILKQNPKINVDKALERTTMSSFSNWITAPTFGYSGKDDYYAAGIIYPWHISQISVPYISFSSSDDRICKLRMNLVHAFESNPMTVHIKLQCGGHMGFLEGMLPKSVTWLNRAARQLLAALKHHQHLFSDNLQNHSVELSNGRTIPKTDLQ